MPKLVNLPNGKQGSFPDDMSWEDIQSVLQKQFSPDVPRRTMLEKSGDLAQKYINNPIESIGLPNVAGGLVEGTANIVPGTKNLIKKGLNLIPGVNMEMDQNLDFLPNTTSSKVGNALSYLIPNPGAEILGATKIPEHLTKIPQIASILKKSSEIIGKSPSAIQKILKSSESLGKNALDVASRSADDQGINALLGAGGGALGKLVGVKNPFISALGRSAIGGALGYGFGGTKGAEYGAAAGLAGPRIMREFGIGSKPGMELLNKVNPLALERAKSGISIGRPLNIAEATGRGDVSHSYGRFERQNSGKSADLIENQEIQDQESVNSLLNKIFDNTPESKNSINNMYKELRDKEIDINSLNKLRNDPDIDDAIKKVRADSTLNKEIKDLPDTNLSVLDQAQQYLSDRYETLMGGEKPKRNKARIVNKSREDLLSELDNLHPEYATTRAKAQPQIIRKNIYNKMNNKPLTGASFYKTFLRNPNKFQELYDSLKNVPEAQKHLTDMKKAFRYLSEPPTMSRGRSLAQSGTSQSRTIPMLISDSLHGLLGSKVSEDTLEYLSGPRWVKDVEKIHKSKNPIDKENKISLFFSKILPGFYNSTEKGED